MKAVLDRDIIVRTGRGDTEIGDLPAGVGLERLRWNGSQIIDLASLDEMWVEYVDGIFKLHCIEVPGSVKVAMSYGDRKRLTTNGSVRVLTDEEIELSQLSASIDAIKARLEHDFFTDQKLTEILTLFIGILAAVIIFARTGDATIRARLDAILPQLQALPLARMTEGAGNKLTLIKTILENYYAKLDAV